MFVKMMQEEFQKQMLISMQQRLFDPKISYIDYAIEMLVGLNVGVDRSQLSLVVNPCEPDNIRFGNLYTILVYRGLWDSQNLKLKGAFEGDSFIDLDGNKYQFDAETGDLLFQPIAPLEYINIDVTITKEGVINNGKV